MLFIQVSFYQFIPSKKLLSFTTYPFSLCEIISSLEKLKLEITGVPHLNDSTKVFSNASCLEKDKKTFADEYNLYLNLFFFYGNQN